MPSISNVNRSTVFRDALSGRGFLAVILVLAAGLRLAHLAAYRSTIYFDNLDLDPQSFDLWGQQIAAGNWLGDRMFFVDPLYPYVLGFLYALAGHDLLLVRLVQLAIGVGTCLLTGMLGRALFGGMAGNCAALIYTLYKPAIFYEAEVEKTVLAVFLFTACLVLFLRPSPIARLAAGVYLGLAILARTNLVLVAPLLLAFLFLHRGSLGAERRRWLAMVAVFAAGVTLVIAPILVRNRVVGGEWALTTSAGQNFYIGNNAFNAAGGYGVLPFVRPTPLFEEVDFAAEAQRRVGRPLTPNQTSSFWFGEALHHILAEPAFALTVAVRKLVLALNDYELPDNQDMYFLAQESPVLRWPLPTFGWLFPIALFGFVTAHRRRETRLFSAVALVFVGSIVLFFVQARFRMPLVPLLAVYGASGLVWLLDRLRERRWPVLGAAAGAVAAVGLFCFHLPPSQDRNAHVALSWSNRGGLHARLGNIDAAIADYRRALQLLPDNDSVLREFGGDCLSAGRFAEAIDALRACVAVNPQHPDAWSQLGRAYQGAGQPALAAQAYRTALELRPDNRDAAAALVLLPSAPH